jgi:integrase
MARPTRRKNSSFLLFKQRIPSDVRKAAVGKMVVVPLGAEEATIRIGPKTQVVQFSLRTRDPAEAKARQVIALERLGALWESIRKGPIRLTQKQVVGLAGEVYRELVARYSDDPGAPEGWEWIQRFVERPLGSGLRIGEVPKRPSTHVPSTVDEVLGRHSLLVDDDTQRRLALAIREVFGRAAHRLANNARGDYSPDKYADRFPPVDLDKPSASKSSKSAVSLTSLVEGWWQESKLGGTAKPATYVNYSNTMAGLVTFLGHDDALRVTPDDIVAYKDYRLTTPSKRTGKVVSPRTVKDTDLAGLKSIFRWAVENHKLPTNPAEGVTVRLGKRAKENARRGFTDLEAVALLRACREVRRGGPGELATTYLVKRWLPWVLAYTGARVGEIAQLRKQDVRRVGSHWEIHIDPEAGTVKTDQARDVPVHPALVQEGFIDFVKSAEAGYLFVRPNAKTGDVLGPLRGVENRVREFVRGIVTDRKVDPNHGWRHLFITRCRAAGVSPELRRMITGHAGVGVDERIYGGPAGLYREIKKLPAFQLR